MDKFYQKADPKNNNKKLPQKLVHYLVGDFNGASKESNYIFYNTKECKKELQTDL